MGLLSIIRKIKKKEKEMRILMVGLDNSGKTTIVLKINGEDTSVISPTLGFNIKTIAYQKYTLNIWDVGGQKTIRSYWRNYFEQTDGLVWVMDSSDLRRLDDCRYELHNLLKEEAFLEAVSRFSGIEMTESYPGGATRNLRFFAAMVALVSLLPKEQIQI
nr:ADP-ribosylation factor-like protein 2 [Ipomoea batatas]